MLASASLDWDTLAGTGRTRPVFGCPGMRTQVAPWDVYTRYRGVSEAGLLESRLLVDWRLVEIPGLFHLGVRE
jgi:hypothetical protein